MTRRCCCLWPEGFTLPWPKVMWPRSRSINTFLIVYCTWSPAYLLDHQHIYVSLWSSAYLCISLSTGRDIFFLPLHPSVPAYGISSDHLFVVYQKVTKFLITYITYRAKVWWCPNKLLTFFLSLGKRMWKYDSSCILRQLGGLRDLLYQDFLYGIFHTISRKYNAANHSPHSCSRT